MKNYKNLISRIARTAKVLSCGCLVALTCSCEDFLHTVPTDKIVSDDFWKTKTDVENVAAESYRLMAQWNFLSRVLVWGELRGDNVVEGDYGGNADIENVVDANLLPSNGYASWEPFYKVINNCNIVLESAEAVLDEDPDFTRGDCDVILGEMYAIRALCHFYLVRTFRDIPLMTKAVVDNTQELYHKQVAPIVVLDSCLADLERAEDLVLASGNYISNLLENKGRFTKDAVRTMRADVLLWKAAFIEQETKEPGAVATTTTTAQECYDECIEYCDKVLKARMSYVKANKERENNLKVLFTNVVTRDEVQFPIVFAKNFDLEISNGKRFPNQPYLHRYASADRALCEGIFEIQHTTNEEDGNYEVPFFYGYANTDNNFVLGKLSASKYLAVAGNLYKRSDFRRVNYIYAEQNENNVDKYQIVKYGYRSATENRGNLSSDENFKFGKVSYTFWKNNTGGNGRYFSDAQVNWGVYNIADVMLMQAEALTLRNNGVEDLDRAFQLVEAIYSRSQSGYRFGNNSSFGETNSQDRLNRNQYMTAEQMYNLVLDERQREFAFEGKRWYDLVRVALHDNSTEEILKIVQKAGNNVENFEEYKMKMATINSLFFPIPERDINVSKGSLKQNPVYETKDSFADADNEN